MGKPIIDNELWALIEPLPDSLRQHDTAQYRHTYPPIDHAATIVSTSSAPCGSKTPTTSCRPTPAARNASASSTACDASCR